jgi:hypothetical protein
MNVRYRGKASLWHNPANRRWTRRRSTFIHRGLRKGATR